MTKKILWLLCLSFVLAGCSISKQNSEAFQIEIETVSKDTDEFKIIHATGVSHQMIFALKSVGNLPKSADVWIDHYKKGEFVNTISKLTSHLISDEEEMKIYFTIMNVKENLELWNMSFSQGANVANMKIPMDKVSSGNVLTHALSDFEITNNKPIQLGTIVSNPSKNFTSSSDDIESTIQANEEVYVLRCQFN